MIVKKIPNPKKSAAKARRVVALGNYIAEPEKENGVEKCIHFQANNFLTDTRDAQLAEMVALASETRSADPVDHWVLSWRADERPTIEQAREAVEIFIRHCGLAEHQFMWGFHDDTDNLHCHIQVNRVHPVTLRVLKINKCFDREAGQQAAALIEHAQGWKPEKRSRYKVIDGKPVLRDSSKAKREKLEPSAAAIAKEIQTGEKSAQRIGIEDAAPLIAAARSWRELHDALAGVGMRYERKGSGAIIFVGDQPIKASDVSRGASLSQLQTRLGVFIPSAPLIPCITPAMSHLTQSQLIKGAENVLRTSLDRGIPPDHILRANRDRQQRRIEDLTAEGAGGLHDLSVSGMDDTGRDSGMLLPNALHAGLVNDQQQAGHDQDLRRPGTGEESSRSRRALKPNQSGWDEYQSIKAERKAAKEAATANLQARQETARGAMFERHKAERAELFANRSWKGQGIARNAMLSLIATRHAAEKLELREAQKAERAELREQHPQLPQYKQWKEQPQVVSEVGRIEIKPARPVVQQPQLAALLRSLRQSPDFCGHFTYRAGNVALFRDEGKIISVLNRDSKSIAAALVVAQSKYGQTLTLTGSHDFQMRAVCAAVEYGLTVKFKDPALEEYRLKLVEEQKQATRAARQAQKQPAAEQAQPTPTNQPNPAQAPGQQPQQPEFDQPAPVPVLSAADWIAQQDKPQAQPIRASKTEFVVVHVADQVVLDQGRSVAVYPLPAGVELHAGDRVAIQKDGSLVLAGRSDPERSKEQSR